MTEMKRAGLRAYAAVRTFFHENDPAAAVRALGFVQIDPIRAPAKAQDLILRHRVVDYRAGDLEARFPELPLVEDFVHVYGVLPEAGLMRDGVHPDGAGHDEIVKVMLPAIARAAGITID